MPLCIRRHLRIKDIRKDLGRKINDRHADPFCLQVFSRLETDEASSDDNRFLYIVRLCICTDSLRIVRGAHLKYTQEISALHRQLRRGGSHSDHQLVIWTGFFLSRYDILNDHFLFLHVQSGCFLPGPHFYTRQSRIFLGRIHDQLIPALDKTAYIVGKPASRIGDILISCDDCDLCAPILSL